MSKSKPRTTLLSTITDKAMASFTGGPVTKENYEAWRQHWIATADTWCAELLKEGLPVTATAVKEHADYERNKPSVL